MGTEKTFEKSREVATEISKEGKVTRVVGAPPSMPHTMAVTTMMPMRMEPGIWWKRRLPVKASPPRESQILTSSKSPMIFSFYVVWGKDD